MEQVIRDQFRPPCEDRIPSLRLPRYFFIVLLPFIGFTLMNLGASALGRQAVPPPDPLAIFTEYLPGQPSHVVETLGFTCNSEINDYDLEEQSCHMRLAAGAFDRVGILISKHGTIRSSIFFVRGNSLRLGGLMMSLGDPEVRRYGRQAVFVWREGRIMASAISNTGLFTPFTSLKTVSFTDPRH